MNCLEEPVFVAALFLKLTTIHDFEKFYAPHCRQRFWPFYKNSNGLLNKAIPMTHHNQVWVSSRRTYSVDEGVYWFILIQSKGNLTWSSQIGCGVSLESSWWAGPKPLLTCSIHHRFESCVALPHPAHLICIAFTTLSITRVGIFWRIDKMNVTVWEIFLLVYNLTASIFYVEFFSLGEFFVIG